MGNWTNGDGLYIKYGPEEVTPSKAGEYMTGGVAGEHIVEFDIDYTMLATGVQIMADNVVLPNKAFIEKIEVTTTTAWTGAGFVMNLGTIRLDRTSTGVPQGLLAAIPLASMDTIGETTTLVVGSTYVGSQVGTVLTVPRLITADWDTGAPTLGKSKFRVFYDFRNV